MASLQGMIAPCLIAGNITRVENPLDLKGDAFLNNSQFPSRIGMCLELNYTWQVGFPILASNEAAFSQLLVDGDDPMALYNMGP